MAHQQQQDFCNRMRAKYPLYFQNANILDIGSLDINGNNRYLFNMDNCSYKGCDIAKGPNVDIICPAHLLNAQNGFYDFIISTECFEHDMYWKESVINIIRMLRKNGAFLFTCAADPRPEHGTERTDDGFSAPFLLLLNNEWKNHYKNLSEQDFLSIPGFKESFEYYEFEYNPNPGDLYFWGVKK